MGRSGIPRAERGLIPGFLRYQVVLKALNRRPERRDIVLDGSLDDGSVDPEVGMDQFVAHAGHLAPGKRGTTLPDVAGDSLRRLTVPWMVTPLRSELEKPEGLRDATLHRERSSRAGCYMGG